MPPAESLEILRDIYVIAILAFAAAAGFYAILRKHSDNLWNFEGNVLTRPYGGTDAVVALLILALFGSAFFAPAAPVEAAGEVASGKEPLTLMSLLLQTITMLLLCSVVLFYLRIIRGMNPAEMFGLRQMSMKRAALYALLALIVTVIGMMIGTMALSAWSGGKMPDPSTQETVQAFEKSGSLPFRIMLGFMAVITAPITEELIFRGFLYGVVKRSTDRWFAAVFTAVIFAVVHMHAGSAPQLCMLGLGLAIAYEQSGCLLVPIFMHMMFNAWNMGMLIWAAAST